MRWKLEKSVGFYPLPIYKKIAGSYTSGIMLLFLMNHFVMKGKFVCDNEEVKNACGFTNREFIEAINRIKKLPFLCIRERKTIQQTTFTLLKKEWRLYFLHSKPNPFKSNFCITKCPKESINTLFPVINNKKKNTNTKIIKEMCVNTHKESYKSCLWSQLAETFIKATSIERRVSPSPLVWGRMLKRFSEQEKIPEEKIKKVILWYSSKFNKDINPYSRKYLPKFVPQANSMSGFLNKYFDIEVAMLREIENDDMRLLPDKDILTKEEMKSMKSMKINLKKSPKTDLSTLPCLVKSLTKKLIECRSKLKKLKIDSSIKDLYLTNIFSHDNFFVSYSIWIDNEVRNWNDWSGDLNSFSPEKSKNFKRYINYSFSQCGYTPDEEVRRIL